jgi:hypothetical protein
MRQSNNTLVLNGRGSVEPKPPSLETLHKEIILYIFEMLDTKSVVAVIITCKDFHLISEHVSKSFVDIWYIRPLGVGNVRDIFFEDFEYPFDYVTSKLNLVKPWVKFKQVIQGSKTEIFSGCSTKALFWVQEEDYVKNDTLQLLQRFIYECPQTRILFWKGSPILFDHTLLPHEFKKLRSLEYLFIDCSDSHEDWPQFFNQFPGLKCIYFRPSGLCYMPTWTVDTQRTLLFIMDHACIREKSDTLV